MNIQRVRAEAAHVEHHNHWPPIAPAPAAQEEHDIWAPLFGPFAGSFSRVPERVGRSVYDMPEAFMPDWPNPNFEWSRMFFPTANQNAPLLPLPPRMCDAQSDDEGE